MRLHTNVLTTADLSDALTETGLTAEGVFMDVLTLHGSRSHARAFEFRLGATPAKGRRRRNTGHYGAEDAGMTQEVAAATYDEHGRWMAYLYERDPYAKIGPYTSVDDFHAKTKSQYK